MLYMISMHDGSWLVEVPLVGVVVVGQLEGIVSYSHDSGYIVYVYLGCKGLLVRDCV